MDKLTIGLIVIMLIISGVIGYIFGSLNSESLPIILSNNTTNDSGSDWDTKTTTKKNKTSITTKKNVTPVTNTTLPPVTPPVTCETVSQG